MIGIRKAAAVAVATGTVVAGLAPTATADELGPQHNITCKWNQNTGTPWLTGSTTVKGYVQVLCSDRLDDANTRAQVQIYRDGGWKNQGAGVTSHSTAKTIHVNDGTSKRIGNWRYRTKGTHFGQHGNIFSLPTFYSPTRMLWRNG